MSLKLKKRERNKVPKFKVGDKVKVLIYPMYCLIGKIGVIIKVEKPKDRYDTSKVLLVEFENNIANILHSGGIDDGKYNRWKFYEENLELVQTPPKFELGQKVAYVYKFQAYIGIVVRRTYGGGTSLNVSSEPTYDIKTYGDVVHEDIKESYVNLYKEETELPKFAFEIAYDLKDYFKSIYDKGEFKVKNTIPGIRPIPNKLPDRVVFNSSKGKTTILFSLHDNGLPPYAPFTSKTVGSDKFDRSMGFLIAYYKYINREMNEDRLREQIELIFDYNKNDRTMYLSGAIEQALLPHYTKERIFEVFEAILKCEGTFDLLQYEETKLKEQRKKEALRKKNINKQIKKREIEIKGLKEKL